MIKYTFDCLEPGLPAAAGADKRPLVSSFPTRRPLSAVTESLISLFYFQDHINTQVLAFFAGHISLSCPHHPSLFSVHRFARALSNCASSAQSAMHDPLRGTCDTMQDQCPCRTSMSGRYKVLQRFSGMSFSGSSICCIMRAAFFLLVSFHFFLNL